MTASTVCSLHTLWHACRLSKVDVCDKLDVSSSDPSLDASYYSSFAYTLLDGSGEEIVFDSTPAKDPTGEVQVRNLLTDLSLSQLNCQHLAHAHYFPKMQMHRCDRPFAWSAMPAKHDRTENVVPFRLTNS